MSQSGGTVEMWDAPQVELKDVCVRVYEREGWNEEEKDVYPPESSAIVSIKVVSLET